MLRKFSDVTPATRMLLHYIHRYHNPVRYRSFSLSLSLVSVRLFPYPPSLSGSRARKLSGGNLGATQQQVRYKSDPTS